jgi:prevent-host-death family protein
VKETTLGVSEFKAKCLHLLEEVERRGDHLVITKRGRPIARVMPVGDQLKPLRGSWEGIVKGEEDVVCFDLSGDWEANQ